MRSRSNELQRRRYNTKSSWYLLWQIGYKRNIKYRCCLSVFSRPGKNVAMVKPRLIFLRFSDHRLYQRVWAAKCGLETTGITLSEFLTASRCPVFVEARKTRGVKGCWSMDGKIIVVYFDGMKKVVTTMSELSAFTSCKQTSTSNIHPTGVEGKLLH